MLAGGLITTEAHNASAFSTATFPGANGRIVFTTRHDDNGNLHDQIYSMNPDGTDQRRLTNNANHDGAPSWSPDGTKIAFHRNTGNGSDIYVMNADGTGQHKVTTGTPASSPKWSPDGTKIAFQGHVDSNPEIFVVNADGRNKVRLTYHPATTGPRSGRRTARRSCT